MPIATIGIDLVEKRFTIRGADKSGKTMLIKPHVLCDQLENSIAQSPASLAGMESYSDGRIDRTCASQ
jgi:hypothetical protein